MDTQPNDELKGDEVVAAAETVAEAAVPENTDDEGLTDVNDFINDEEVEVAEVAEEVKVVDETAATE